MYYGVLTIYNNINRYVYKNRMYEVLFNYSYFYFPRYLNYKLWMICEHTCSYCILFYNDIGQYSCAAEILFVAAAFRSEIGFSAWPADSKTESKSNNFAL